MFDPQIAQLTEQGNLIDLGIGQPGYELLPLELLRQAANHRLGQPEPSILQYGRELGDGYFRETLAEWLSRYYQTAVSADELMISNGISQALDFVCTVLTCPGDLIFVEEPTYFLASDIFADYQLQVVSLPLDEHGLQIEALESALAKQTPRLLYTIPTFHNPTGTTLSPERRERLIALSRQHGFTIVADEVYQLLPYTAVPPAPFANAIHQANILSLGSFSKILAPGLRLGWIQAAPERLRPFVQAGYVQSGGGLNPFTSAIVRSMIEQGWQTEHLTRLQAVYQERMDALYTAVQSAFSDVASCHYPGGGFFLWLVFHDPDFNTEAFLETAQTYEVAFKAGILFSQRGELRHCMRLCFAFYDAPALETAVTRLQHAYKALVQHKA